MSGFVKVSSLALHKFILCRFRFSTSVPVELHWQREKETKINAALESDPVDIHALRELAVSLGGLLHSRIRKKAWPKLAGVNVFYIPPYEGPSLSGHKDRSQVLLDVNRCGKRIPKRKTLAYWYMYSD